MVILLSGPWVYRNRHHLYSALDAIMPTGIVLVRHEHPQDVFHWCATRYAREWWACRLRIVDTPFLAFGTITPRYESTARNLPDAVLTFPIAARTVRIRVESAPSTQEQIVQCAQRYGVPVLDAGPGDARTARSAEADWPKWRRAWYRRRRRGRLSNPAA